MYNQQTNFDGFQVPSGMMLVAAPQQQQTFPRVIEPSQQQTFPRVIEPSQQQMFPRVIEPSQQQTFPKVIEPYQQQQQTYPTVSQYNPSAVAHSNSFKTSRVAQPLSTHRIQPVDNMLQNNCIK
jgi:hypothetical protein